MNKEKTIFFITIISAIIVLVIAASLSVIISKEKEDLELKLNRSIYNTKPSGYAAWYKVATGSDINVKPWRNTFRSLRTIDKDDRATMLIVSPEYIAGGKYVFTSSDQESLLDWVRKGNTLIYVDDFNKRSSESFLEKLKIKEASLINDDDDKDKDKDNDKYDQFFRNIEDLYDKEKTLYDISKVDAVNYKADEISTTCKVRLKEKYIEPLIVDEDGLLLGVRQYGKGKIYILTIPDVVDNSTLYENEDNYQFFTNLILAGGKKILVNEYVHGFIKSDNVLAYYEKTLFSPIFKQLLLLIIVLVWSVSRRFGKIRAVKDPERNTNLEYVQAMGNLYSQARLTGTVLKPIYNQFRLNLCKELRMDVKASNEDLLRLVKKHYSNQQARELSDLLVEVGIAMRRNDISREDMLDFCQRLNNYRLKGSRYAKRS